MYESSKVNCTTFFPLNVQVLEKNFLRKSCSISKNKHKTTLKNINFAHNICMSHQRSILHHFFPLNVQVLEKSFFRRSCSISKN